MDNSFETVNKRKKNAEERESLQIFFTDLCMRDNQFLDIHCKLFYHTK